jgi:hypothetical protein
MALGRIKEFTWRWLQNIPQRKRKTYCTRYSMGLKGQDLTIKTRFLTAEDFKS